MPIAAAGNERWSQAYDLALRRYEIETGLKTVFYYRGDGPVDDGDEEPIRLLEVNENTIPSGIMPIQFAPSPEIGIAFPTAIIEVTPEEFEKIERQELALPAGWKHPQLISRPST